jgi:Cu+-exporting ATPase
VTGRRRDWWSPCPASATSSGWSGMRSGVARLWTSRFARRLALAFVVTAVAAAALTAPCGRVTQLMEQRAATPGATIASAPATARGGGQLCDQLEADGHTVIVVAADQAAVGAIALGDELRPDAVSAVAAMRRAGLDPVLVTGDNARAAHRVARQLGITQVHAGVRPEDKAQIVRRLQADGTRVAMAGDGINDAPALMQADVGVAAGVGTDIAVESADIVLLREEVGAILEAREISSRAFRRTQVNVALAFTFNGIGVPLATTGLVHPVWAMVAMAASVTAIFLNSIGTRPSLLFQAITSVGRR